MRSGVFRKSQAELIRGAAALDLTVQALRACNDKLERSLGMMSVGGVKVEAVQSLEAAPEIRVNGRVRYQFSVVEGMQEARQSARRTFERLATAELVKPRSAGELRQTVMFDGPTVRRAASGEIEVCSPVLQLTEET